MALMADLIAQSPLEAGFNMPAEWEPHARCWMAWPHQAALWPGDLDQVQRAYATVAQAIRRFEPVTMVTHPTSAEGAQQLLGPEIDVLAVEIDDSWTRDSAPSFLTHTDGGKAGTAWRFNAWGSKTGAFDEDARLAERMLSHLEFPIYRSPLYMEGGAVHVDGDGTALTTESVVLNQNRNPGLTKADEEKELCRALGVSKVIWLPGDLDKITSDMTDGHIDGLACFVRPGAVLYEADPSAQGALADMAKENLRALELAIDAKGRSLEIIPMEDAWEAETPHDLFCRSYVNFYIANGGIVMPKYGIPADERARDVIAKAYSGHEVVQVDINEIAPGGGGIHCITQQQPA